MCRHERSYNAEVVETIPSIAINRITTGLCLRSNNPRTLWYTTNKATHDFCNFPKSLAVGRKWGFGDNVLL